MRATVKTGAASEKTISVCYLTNILLSAAYRNYSAGAAIFPKVDILLRVESYYAATGSAGG
jgi:hypothetical protein